MNSIPNFEARVRAEADAYDKLTGPVTDDVQREGRDRIARFVVYREAGWTTEEWGHENRRWHVIGPLGNTAGEVIKFKDQEIYRALIGDGIYECYAWVAAVAVVIDEHYKLGGE